MKRLIGSLLITMAIVAALAGCSCKGPKPTDTPSATETKNTTLTPEATLTPAGSPVPRITIVPSATPLPKTPSPGPSGAAASPTSAMELRPTSASPPTPTPRVIDAGATATSPATATPPDSPLPTPTVQSSPLAQPPGTPSPSPESTQSPTSFAGSATPTPTAPTDATSPPTDTPTASATSAPVEGNWDFENIYAYYDDVYQEFYVWGELVNHTGDHQRVTTLWPVVYDEVGEAATTKDDVNAIGSGYKDLREGISLAPDQSLAFNFLVYLPEGVTVDDNYEIVIESEPAEQGRDDLEIPYENFDDTAWPILFFVEGTFEIPAPDLNEYVAVVVTLYDEDDRVIGVGWLYEESSTYLTADSHDFEIEVEMWDVASDLELEVYFYKVQVFGN
jgi:predicted small lipoprotein YifL